MKMKVFDIHAHIYPEKIADKAVHSISALYGGFEMKGDGRAKTLIQRMDAAGIDQCAAHSAATTAHQVSSINRFILSEANQFPDRIVPFATLHPDVPDLESAIAEICAGGFSGIKLHPEFQGFKVDEPRAIRMFDLIGDRIPILLHCGDAVRDNSAPERILHLLKEVPRIRLVCAHLGGWQVWERAASVLTGANIWVDTSSALYALSPERAAAIIRGYGTERALFGSDFPMWDPAEELRRFLNLPLTDSERENILWNNHIRLFQGEK